MGAAGGNQAAGGAGGASSYEALKKLDQQWLQMRSMTTTTQGTHAYTHTSSQQKLHGQNKLRSNLSTSCSCSCS